MKTTGLATTCAFVMTLFAGAAMAADGDRAAIEAVIKTAYVDGVHAKGDPALMRQGFHPDFRMLVLKDGVMTPVDARRVGGADREGGPRAQGPRPQIRHEFTLVDVTGKAAVARVELFRDGKHVFTDYLSLYQFADGWKIVSKIFQSRT